MNAPLTLPPVSRAVVMSGARSVTDPDCFIDRDMPPVSYTHLTLPTIYSV